MFRSSMKTILGKIVITLPVATILYISLLMLAGLDFDARWLTFAIALDVADWIVAEIT